jgi:hypothetical protein
VENITKETPITFVEKINGSLLLVRISYRVCDLGKYVPCFVYVGMSGQVL